MSGSMSVGGTKGNARLTPVSRAERRRASSSLEDWGKRGGRWLLIGEVVLI